METETLTLTDSVHQQEVRGTTAVVAGHPCLFRVKAAISAGLRTR